jgi:predicted nucleic acid-binding protein
MADYFLDTSVLVAYFKKEDARTHDLMAQVLEGQATAAISAVTVAEVWSASDMADESARRDRQATMELCQVLPVDRLVAERAGELRRRHALALPDALIAASAEQSTARFLSKDPHFSRLLSAGVLQGEVYE